MRFVCDQEDVLLLLAMAEDGDGTIELGRILARSSRATSRAAATVAIDRGWLSEKGFVTSAGSEAVRAWRDGFDEHVIDVGTESFTVTHPLNERPPPARTPTTAYEGDR